MNDKQQQQQQQKQQEERITQLFCEPTEGHCLLACV